MRIKFKNKILETDYVSNPKETNFVNVRTSNGIYTIDCEGYGNTVWLMHKLLTDGYFDVSGVDYNNDQFDESWFEYCLNKTEEQKVFSKWINGDER